MSHRDPGTARSPALRSSGSGWWTAAVLAVLACAFEIAGTLWSARQRLPTPTDDAAIEAPGDTVAPDEDGDDLPDTSSEQDLADRPAEGCEHDPREQDEPLWIGGPEPTAESTDADGVARVRELLEERALRDRFDPSQIVEPDPDDDGSAARDDRADVSEALAALSGLSRNFFAERDPAIAAMEPAQATRTILLDGILLALGLLVVALGRRERDRAITVAGVLWAATGLLGLAALIVPIRGAWHIAVAAQVAKTVATGAIALTARRFRPALVSVLACAWMARLLFLHLHWGMAVFVAVEVAPWAAGALALAEDARRPSAAGVRAVGAGPYRVAVPRPSAEDHRWLPRAVARVATVGVVAAIAILLARGLAGGVVRILDPELLACELAVAVAAFVGAGRVEAPRARRTLAIAAALFAALPLDDLLARSLGFRSIVTGTVWAFCFVCGLVATLRALEDAADDRARAAGREPPTLQPAELATVIAGAIALTALLGIHASELGVAWPLVASISASGAWMFRRCALRFARWSDALDADEARAALGDQDDDEDRLEST